jgi:hypothetical protein
MAHSEKYIPATEESPLVDEFQSLPFACVRQLFYASSWCLQITFIPPEFLYTHSTKCIQFMMLSSELCLSRSVVCAWLGIFLMKNIPISRRSLLPPSSEQNKQHTQREPSLRDVDVRYRGPRLHVLYTPYTSRPLSSTFSLIVIVTIQRHIIARIWGTLNWKT